MRSNALLSGGAETTVSCGATSLAWIFHKHAF
jgi:hypothetical protein